MSVGPAGHLEDSRAPAVRSRHQTRSAWYHQRTRIARDAETALVS
ncbi:MAG: hypothetical protein ACLPUO_13390 [Streptosporangiaceae bacterium]